MDTIKLASAIFRKVAVDLSADDSYYEIDGDRHYRNDIDALADRLAALKAEPEMADAAENYRKGWEAGRKDFKAAHDWYESTCRSGNVEAMNEARLALEQPGMVDEVERLRETAADYKAAAEGTEGLLKIAAQDMRRKDALIEAAEANLAAAEAELSLARAESQGRQDACAALSAKLAAMEANDARYRWLRGQGLPGYDAQEPFIAIQSGGAFSLWNGEPADAAIDAARAAP